MTALAAEAYDELAPFYDRFTAHHDYELWTSALLPVVERYGLSGRRLLDLACGTGKSFLPFLERGFAVVGCDVSAEMVALARGKARGRAHVLQADMRALGDLGTYDLVICLDDALNYLLNEDELTHAFASAARQMGERGLFLFDVTTLHGYGTFFAQTSVVDDDDLVMVWRGHGSTEPEEAGLVEATLDAWHQGSDGRWDRVTSRHVQRHHPENVVRDALDEAGLRCLGVFGQHFDAKLVHGVDEQCHTKAVFVASRRGTP